MACVKNAPANIESEMEEGEIVDDLDDLSDISSEEEFLLRQRLEVLENYNNVLERKKAKNSSFGPGNQTEDMFLELSDISTTNLEDHFSNFNPKTVIVRRNVKNERHIKSHHKPKRRKDLEPHTLVKPKDTKKKVHRKKKLQLKVISESSEESEDEYRNKRRKLANAVSLNRSSNDKSSLQDRLQKMLGGNCQELVKNTFTEDKQTETEIVHSVEDVSCSPIAIDSPENITQEPGNVPEEPKSITEIKEKEDLCEMIDLCTDDDAGGITTDQPSIDTVDSVIKENNSEHKDKKVSDSDSDEDLEKLRQHALKSKALKTKSEQQNAESEKPTMQSEDEDSDTAELRLICLKSALLKKAIEMKQKQKMRKRMSQSSFSMQDDFLEEYNTLGNSMDPGNNTDIESVDMDMGSDAEEKGKEMSTNNTKDKPIEWITNEPIENMQTISENKTKEDELEEDEDLLRAKLLTSLSKNLPNLVDPKVIPNLVDPKVTKVTEVERPRESTPPAPKTKIPENRIVINLGESDSEGEHEATKNLTKMHMKLSEQIDFQQKLDMFLKSTRMEVEKEKLPDVVQNPVSKPPEKFVAKSVNHLPKSEQIEYKNLVKKMAELEKIKEARQNAMNLINHPLTKDTLKPRNVSVDTTRIVAFNLLEEQVAMSRKKIAEESARIMQLKEEGTKLIQKYKIVANELKNISTAITLNKKEQRASQQRLSKIRLQHQRLLNSSLNKHSKINGNMLTANRLNNLQKENNPLKEEYKYPQMQKAVKVSVVNDRVEEIVAPTTRLSVQVDVANNKKSVTSFTNTGERVDYTHKSNKSMENVNDKDGRLHEVEKEGENTRVVEVVGAVEPRIERKNEFDDYKSPLQALEKASWEADPNAIMCPFEVGGNCKDPDCKYLHPKVPSQ